MPRYFRNCFATFYCLEYHFSTVRCICAHQDSPYQLDCVGLTKKFVKFLQAFSRFLLQKATPRQNLKVLLYNTKSYRDLMVYFLDANNIIFGTVQWRCQRSTQQA